jgi:hypothetical protein
LKRLIRSRLQSAVDACVPLPAACAGHVRHARAAETDVVELDLLAVWPMARVSGARIA